MATPELHDVYRGFLEKTARPGRNLDLIMAIDGSGFGTTSLARWYATKYPKGSKSAKNESSAPLVQQPPERRRKRGYIKAHTAMGTISGLIYALSLTLDFGEGTAHTRHFEILVRAALALGNFEVILADKGYWDQWNFGLAQSLGKILIVLIKDNINPNNVERGRELVALIEHLRQYYPSLYRRFYRLRQLVETVFNSQKITTGHIRTRVRKWEHKHFERMSVPPKLASVPKGFEAVDAFRDLVCALFAQEQVGLAQMCEALAKAVSANLRTLTLLEKRLDDKVDFAVDKAFRPRRRVSLPSAS